MRSPLRMRSRVPSNAITQNFNLLRRPYCCAPSALGEERRPFFVTVLRSRRGPCTFKTFLHRCLSVKYFRKSLHS